MEQTVLPAAAGPDFDLRRDLLDRLRDPESRARIVSALLGEAKDGLKPNEALKLLEYAQEALEADRPARELPGETDMSQYSDAQLRAMLAELEAAPDG